MTKEALLQSLAALRAELSHAEQEKYECAAPKVKDLRALLDAFDAQQLDIEDLALMYGRSIHAVTPLIFYARAAVLSMRPAKKGRIYISQGVADGLSEAVKSFTKADANQTK